MTARALKEAVLMATASRVRLDLRRRAMRLVVTDLREISPTASQDHSVPNPMKAANASLTRVNASHSTLTENRVMAISQEATSPMLENHLAAGHHLEGSLQGVARLVEGPLEENLQVADLRAIAGRNLS